MENVIFDFAPSATISAGGTVWENGVSVGGGWPIRAGWVSAVENASLRFGFRYEPWRTIASERTRDPVRSSYEIMAGDPQWVASFNHFSYDGTNTLLTVVLNREPTNWRMRVVALDTDGVEHSMRRGMSTPIGDTETWTCTFPNLALDRVEEFRVQVQCVRWVDFAMWR